jgi:hypothetical protein
MNRKWTVKNTKTGEYAHLYSEQECEDRKAQWIKEGKVKEQDIEIKYDPPQVCRTMP